MKVNRVGRVWVCVALMVSCLATGVVFSQENRTWTDRKGRTLEGKLLKVDREEAEVQLKDGKVVRLKIELLSARDHQYLKEYGGAPASTAVVASGKVGMPEKDARIDTKTFFERKEPFVFPDTEMEFDIMESDHFMVMTEGKIRPKNVAETAERLWHGMAFQHPGFRDSWGEMKRAIFIIEEEETHKAVGEWYMNLLDATGRRDQSMQLAITWPAAAGMTIELSDDITGKYSIFPAARVFKVNENSEASYKKVFTPFVTNCVANDMLRTHMGGTTGFGTRGYFAITTGHAYYKEIQLAGESQTRMITARYDSSEIQNAKGFDDGTSWAKELKKLVKKGTVVPSIEALYDYKTDGLKPEELVLLYSFSYFMQSDMARLTNYTKMAQRVNSSKAVPAPIELASMFGFETVEEMQTAWTEFIKSTDFKD